MLRKRDCFIKIINIDIEPIRLLIEDQPVLERNLSLEEVRSIRSTPADPVKKLNIEQ